VAVDAACLAHNFCRDCDNSSQMRFGATTVKLERIWKHSNVELVRCGLLDFRVYLNDTLDFVYVLTAMKYNGF